LNDSFLYELLVEKAIDTPGAEPLALVTANYAFEPKKDDVAALMRVAKIAAVADAPFVSHMRPDVLGVHSLDGNSDPAEWKLSSDTEVGKLWAVLRGISEGEYLGMTIPRFLARLPYGSETEPLEMFQFEEFTGAPEHDGYLWSNSCFVAALLLAQSFSAYGWQMNQRFLQDIERLPMYTYEQDGETIYQPCAEVLLTQNACEKLMEYGLMPLISYKNTDHVKLARFQSISDPITGLKGKWN
jgi:type VI secretion system protein ImpC